MARTPSRRITRGVLVSVSRDTAIRVAHEAVEQDAGPRSNVSNLRPRGVYDGAGDDIRSAATDVWSWTLLLNWALKCPLGDAPEAVRSVARELRAHLNHPAQS